MKKVLLVTLWDYGNFGNRLQAIALKTMIENNGYEVVCVPNKRSVTMKTRIKTVLAYCGVKRFRYIKFSRIRQRSIYESTKLLLPNCTPEAKYFRFPSSIDCEAFSAAVVGSDQVWHGWSDHQELDFFYLHFISKEKRISYAASFGFDVFPEKDKEKHKSGLENMRFISCREKKGCELVESISSKKATWVLDPTLCIERGFWEGIEKKPKYDIPSDYIFCMMLGSKEAYYPFMKEYAKKNHLAIVDIKDNENLDVWTTSIGELIWLIHNAKYICTDSFHCSVFSIQFEKPLTVFKRKGNGFEHMYSRILTLLESGAMMDCQFDGQMIHDKYIDYQNVKKLLAPQIEVSTQWLKDALFETTSRSDDNDS